MPNMIEYVQLDELPLVALTCSVDLLREDELVVKVEFDTVFVIESSLVVLSERAVVVSIRVGDVSVSLVESFSETLISFVDLDSVSDKFVAVFSTFLVTVIVVGDTSAVISCSMVVS